MTMHCEQGMANFEGIRKIRAYKWTLLVDDIFVVRADEDNKWGFNFSYSVLEL